MARLIHKASKAELDKRIKVSYERNFTAYENAEPGFHKPDGNPKIGRTGIISISLLPLVTCVNPNATLRGVKNRLPCAGYCYSCRGMSTRKVVTKAWAENSKLAIEHPIEFRSKLYYEIWSKRKPGIVRWNTAGDFPNYEFFEKVFMNIVNNTFPTFHTVYTRRHSWVDKYNAEHNRAISTMQKHNLAIYKSFWENEVDKLAYAYREAWERIGPARFAIVSFNPVRMRDEITRALLSYVTHDKRFSIKICPLDCKICRHCYKPLTEVIERDIVIFPAHF